MISVRSFRDGDDMAAVAGGMLAAFAVLLIYWPTLENGFVFDDWAILDVYNLVGLSDPALWRETLFRAPDGFSVLFRPLTMLTFLVQLWTWPLVPPAFHFVNLAIHSFNVFLFVLVASRLPVGGGRTPSLLLAVSCGLVYGVHPALTEPVIWISARADLLITFFLLLALVLDRDLSEEGWGRACAVGALFLAAMLCKETAVVFLLVLPMVHVAMRWLEPQESGPGLASTWARHRRVYFALALALTAYLAVRFAVSGPAIGLGHPDPRSGLFSQRVLIMAASFAQHMSNAFWPFQGIVPTQSLRLPIDYREVLPMAAAGAAMILASLAVVCTRSAARVPALLFLAFIAALLPVSNIVLIPVVAARDEIAVGARYLTFPLALACLAVPHIARLGGVSFGKRVRHGAVFTWVVLGAWILGSATSVRTTVPLWSSDLTLHSWAMEQDGGRFWRHASIGMYYLRIQDNRRARDAFVAALQMRDNGETAWIWNMLGLAEVELGRLPEARRAFLRALELGNDELRSRLYLADIEQRLGNPVVAADILEEGLKRAPRIDRARWKVAQMHYQLGLAYLALDRTGDAVTALTAALSLARTPADRKLFEETLRSIAPNQ